MSDPVDRDDVLAIIKEAKAKIMAILQDASLNEALEGVCLTYIEHEIRKLPSAQPDPCYDEWCTDCKEYDQDRHSCPRWNKVIRKTLEDAGRQWIPCSERLPELNLNVLVQLKDDFVDPIQIMTLNISKLEGDFFCFWRTQEMGIDFDMDDVVAWMPLPEPYMEEDNK